MNTLSIFVDESGDFGKTENNSPYYLVSLIFHNQSDDIYGAISALENSLSYCEFEQNYIHTGPLIRREAGDKFALTSQLSKSLKAYISNHFEYFSSFDKIIVYYDNGQQELNLVLNTIFSLLLSNVEFRKASPLQYRLLQLADFVCSIELLAIKLSEKRLSKSETGFFYKPQELKKSFVRAIKIKELL